jgi:hypothetical protein
MCSANFRVDGNIARHKESHTCFNYRSCGSNKCRFDGHFLNFCFPKNRIWKRLGNNLARDRKEERNVRSDQSHIVT